MSQSPFERMMQVAEQLRAAHIFHTWASHRYDAVMILAAVPGERWEIEFLSDGSIEIERFISTGEIEDESALADLLDVDAS